MKINILDEQRIPRKYRRHSKKFILGSVDKNVVTIVIKDVKNDDGDNISFKLKMKASDYSLVEE